MRTVPIDPLLVFIELMQRTDAAPRIDAAASRAEAEREERADAGDRFDAAVRALHAKRRRERRDAAREREAKRERRVSGARWEPCALANLGELARANALVRAVVECTSEHGVVIEVAGPGRVAAVVNHVSGLVAHPEYGAHVLRWECEA